MSATCTCLCLYLQPLPTTEPTSYSEFVAIGPENIPAAELHQLGSVAPPLNLTGTSTCTRHMILLTGWQLLQRLQIKQPSTDDCSESCRISVELFAMSFLTSRWY